jgi:hypothetical protein
MKLFGRTGGYYLFWTGAVYLVTGVTCALFFREVRLEFLQIIWLATLALPFTYPPLGRYFNLDVEWDKNMFWRKRQIADKVAKDIGDFPETPEVPVVNEPEDKFDNSDATYTIGRNNAGNTQLRIKLEYGSTTLTMGPEAVVDMIEQLSVTIRKQYAVEITQLVVEEEVAE